MLCHNLFRSGKRIWRSLVKIGNIKGTHLVVWSHFCCQAIVANLWHIPGTIVEGFEIGAYYIAHVLNHNFCKVGKFLYATVNVSSCQLHADSKYLWVNAHVQLTAELLAKTLFQLFHTFIAHQPKLATVFRLFFLLALRLLDRTLFLFLLGYALRLLENVLVHSFTHKLLYLAVKLIVVKGF